MYAYILLCVCICRYVRFLFARLFERSIFCLRAFFERSVFYSRICEPF